MLKHANVLGNFVIKQEIIITMVYGREDICYGAVKGADIKLLSTRRRLCSCSRRLKAATDQANDEQALVTKRPTAANKGATTHAAVTHWIICRYCSALAWQG